MKQNNNFLLWVLSVFFVFLIPILLLAADFGVGVDLYYCDNDGVCDSNETLATCPNDCTEGGGPIQPALIISSTTVFNITSSSASIGWQTSNLARCQLLWGLDTSYQSPPILESDNFLIHQQQLVNLTASTTYHFRIACQDIHNSSAQTADNQFMTLGEDVEEDLPPANVSDLRIVADDQKLSLFWKNPADTDLDYILIRRSTNYYPDFDEGTVVYQGLGDLSGAERTFVDLNLINDTTYYYTLFAYDLGGNRSSGAGIFGRPFLEEEEATTTPPLPTSTPPLPTSTPPYTTTTPPYSTTTPPTIPTSTVPFVFIASFYQDGLMLPLDNNNSFVALADKSIEVFLSAERFPDNVDKAVWHIYTDTGLITYLFAYNQTERNYSLLAPAFNRSGDFFWSIVFLDSNNSNLGVFSGKMTLKESEKQIEIPIISDLTDRLLAPVQALYKNIQEIADTAEARSAVGASIALSAINIAMGVPWWNWWYLLQLLFTQPLQLLLRRRGWGTVYNAITKKPVDLAVVRLYDASSNALIASRVTDNYGRYIFLVDPGQYYLKVEKPEFEFPSDLLKRVKDDGSYFGLYYGDSIRVTGDRRSVIVANIPLDPAVSDLSDKEIMKRFSKQRWVRRLSWAGPILSIVYLIVLPSWLSLSFVVLHFSLLWFFHRLIQNKLGSYWGKIYDQDSKKPVGKAVTRIFSSEYGRMLEFYVTDRKGRYGFLVDNNKYYVTADKPGYQTSKTNIIDLSSAKEQKIIVKDLPLKKDAISNVDGSSDSSDDLGVGGSSDTESNSENQKINSQEPVDSVSRQEVDLVSNDSDSAIVNNNDSVPSSENLVSDNISQPIESPQVEVNYKNNSNPIDAFNLNDGLDDLDLGSLDEVREAVGIEPETDAQAKKQDLDQ